MSGKEKRSRQQVATGIAGKHRTGVVLQEPDTFVDHGSFYGERHRQVKSNSEIPTTTGLPSLRRSCHNSYSRLAMHTDSEDTPDFSGMRPRGPSEQAYSWSEESVVRHSNAELSGEPGSRLPGTAPGRHPPPVIRDKDLILTGTPNFDAPSQVGCNDSTARFSKSHLTTVGDCGKILLLLFVAAGLSAAGSFPPNGPV